MSGPFFASTWERVRARREAPGWSLIRSILPAPRWGAEEIDLIEYALSVASDETFQSARPRHLDQLKPGAAAKTGIPWIDEQEALRYGSTRD